MFEATRRTSWEACFFFISLILIGHYMLLNLFLAGVVRGGASKSLRAACCCARGLPRPNFAAAT